MRIVYCTDSVCYQGGIQCVTIAKANALAEIPGNQVWIIVADHLKDSIAELNSKVQLLNLQVNYSEDDWKGKLYVLKGILIKRRIHKKRMKQVLSQIQPDIVISTGTSEKYFLPEIKLESKPVFIREIHFFKGYRTASAKNLFQKALAFLGDFYDYKVKIHSYSKIVVLTNEDKTNNWKDEDNILVIPNPNTAETSYKSSASSKIVIAAGRLCSQKNFSSLLRIWKKVNQQCPDWKLQIFGEGEEKQKLINTIQELSLNDSVALMGYSSEIHRNMSEASIFTLTSFFEGFGLVIVEAMSVALPVISYACPCGPKDIITDGVDGYLIEPNDENSFAQKITYLIKDKEKRITMSNNALIKSSNYSLDEVINNWMIFFNMIRNH